MAYDKSVFHRDTVWDVCHKVITAHSGRPDVDLSRLAKRFWRAKGKLFDAIAPEVGRVVVPFDPAKQPGDELMAAAVDRAREQYGGTLADLLAKNSRPEDFEAGAVHPESPLIALSPSIKKGMKLTRAVAVVARQAFPSWGNDEASSAANSVVNGKEVAAAGFLCLSANPLDVFMTSESCSYSSCHRLNGGEYCAANFQFLCDSQSAVAYFYSDERNYSPAGGKTPYKTWRQMVFFDPSGRSVAFGRVYGNPVPESAHALVRREAAHALWRLLGEDGTPTWAVNRKDYRDLFGRTGDDDDGYDDEESDYYQLCYRDPFVKEEGCCWVYLKPKGQHPQVDLASSVPCFACDGIMDCSRYMTCNDCRKNKVICNGCGAKLPDSRVVRHNEATYCQSCFDESFFRCGLCNCTAHNDDAEEYHLGTDGGTGRCCDNCRDSGRALPCTHCDSLWRASDMTATDSGLTCRACVESEFRTCNCCHATRLLKNFDGDDCFCTGCRSEGYVAPCPDCKQDSVKSELKQVANQGDAVCLPCRVQRRLAIRNAQAANASPEAAAANSLVNLLLAAQAETSS